MTARCAALVMAASVSVQTPAPPVATFRAETRLVVLQVSVKDRRGIEVPDLARDAFTIYENGARQTITLFRHDDVPVTLGLVIDNSRSMRMLRPRVEAAAMALVRASNPLDEVFVVNFADRPRVDVPMTNDLQALEAGIGRVDAIGGTAMRDAIGAAQLYLLEHASRDRQVLLVITDGRDNASATGERQLELACERSHTAIYAIGLFSGAADDKHARQELDQLTQHTGGAAYYPERIEDIDAIVHELARHIRNQYTIAYAPTNQALDGSYRRIRVDARGPGPLVVHTRPGYVAAAALPKR